MTLPPLQLSLTENFDCEVENFDCRFEKRTYLLVSLDFDPKVVIEIDLP